MEQEKVCTKCGISKPRSAFSAHKRAKGGLRPSCKQCVAEHYQQNKEKIAEYRRQNKEKRAEYRRQNKEKIAERDAEYRRQNKEKITEYRGEYYQRNKDKVAKQGAEYRRQNKEKITEYQGEYYQQNKEKITEKVASRRRGIRAQKIAKTYAKQNAEIYRWAADCKDLIGGSWHVDHICPIKARVYDPDFDCELLATGLHAPWNLDPKPASENIRKKNRTTLHEILHTPCFSKMQIHS